jgi:cytoskeletal protein CcmA (bactofilin family)
MKTFQKTFILFFLVIVLAANLAAPASAARLEKRITGGTFTLKSGETLNEDLDILGGTVILEEGSTLNGNIQLVGATVTAAGTIIGDIHVAGGIITLEESSYLEGDITTAGSVTVAGEMVGDIQATGGVVNLESTAQIEGDVTTNWAVLNQASGATVSGDVTEHNRDTLVIPGLPGIPEIPLPRYSFTNNPFWSALWFLVRVFIFSAMAVLLAMFFPRSLERTAQAAVSQPLVSGGLGVFTVMIAPLVVIILLVTILLIPAALIGIFLLGVMLILGWIALGYETGRRMAQLLHQEWATPLSAGLGTLLLTFVLSSIAYIPCLGWIPGFAAGMVGLGAVALTIFGTRDYPTPFASSAPRPVTPVLPVNREPPPPPAEDDLNPL